MTCYETLRAPAPAVDAPMAHHFVKWWRNKFRNGYKKFHLDTESEKTDTEELIGRASSQCSAPPDLLPSEARALLQSNSSPPPRTRKEAVRPPPSPTLNNNNNNEKPPRLRYEELTCDVELQHPESSKQQPLQFSFTLYDLDGHGRMTKDDIAGIVSTIYESIGKSVTVPHYGSKTIQVRLTVIPEDDNGCHRSRRERREFRRRRRQEQTVQQSAKTIPYECAEQSEEEHRSRLSPVEDVSSKSSCSAERKPPPARAPPPPRPRFHRHSRKEQRERKHGKKRSGSLQRRELLEIIQANMEKNHLSFQTSRKPTDTTANDDDIKIKYQKLRNRSHTISEKPATATTFHNPKTDTAGHGYLDLASSGCGDSNLCRYDRYLHAVICSSARHANTGYHQKQSPKIRSPSSTKTRPHEYPQQLNTSAHPRVLQIIFL